ncbi:MAG: hypothetical protein AAF468_14195 [Pseudomonadota bacterium]
MTKDLDLADIQGNIVRGYGRYGYPVGRDFFLHVHDSQAGRMFVNSLFPFITTATRWKPLQGESHYPQEARLDRPNETVNIGFTHSGLKALGLPTRTLSRMPPEFIDGMAKRFHILGDVEGSDPKNWDEIWQKNDGETAVHIWVSINFLAKPASETGGKLELIGDPEAKTEWLKKLVSAAKIVSRKTGRPTRKPGVSILAGHGPDKALYQDTNVVMRERDGETFMTAQEHFGYRDGIGDPVFEGQFDESVETARLPGRGKLSPDGEWQVLATGEFLLGHPDESQEIPIAFLPPEVARNGTFMAYRKLHENVGSFHEWTRQSGKEFAKVMGMEEDEGIATLKAKMVGRWEDGTPLLKADTQAKQKEFRAKFLKDLKNASTSGEKAKIYQRETDFVYADDFGGLKCPYSAHLRRANTRDMLDPNVALGLGKADSGSALNKRRRILRRGLPYGSSNGDAGRDDAEHGIIFIAVCASLFRQFEFLQQQWIQYGLDFNAGNDTCPVIGHHPKKGGAKFVVPSDPEGDKPPFIATDIPPLVETRGGDYFFVPGITALRMIAMGIVDPT